MKQFKRVRPLLVGAVVSVALVAGSVASVSAFGSHDRGNKHRKSSPPSSSFSQGPQDKHPVEPGTVDAKETDKRGKTKEVEIAADGTVSSETKQELARAVDTSKVSLEDPLNYCYKNLVYVRVANHTNTTQSVRVSMYYLGGEYTKYANVGANQTAYVAFYGVEGEYAAYLYHWDGSAYNYVSDTSGESICRVAVTRTYNSNGWVQLRIQNTGTAYATQKSSQIAPNAAVGEFTGTHHDKPVAGGEAIYRWFDVSGGAYGIVSGTYGSTNTPFLFSGNV